MSESKAKAVDAEYRGRRQYRRVGPMNEYDHEGREPDDTEEAENILREALGDEVVDDIERAADEEESAHE